MKVNCVPGPDEGPWAVPAAPGHRLHPQGAESSQADKIVKSKGWHLAEFQVCANW